MPPVVSREAWLAEREALLAREKELTRLRDDLNAARRRLPMVKIEKPYVFTGPQGTVEAWEASPDGWPKQATFA
jgi:predicted dithiol-disulfide oxidoreductase (DUF899 family)